MNLSTQIRTSNKRSDTFGVRLILMEFEWDTNKATVNLSKHSVSFDEAKTVFQDPFYIVFDDPDHSFQEDRCVAIGQSAQNRLLFISYTERENTARLISARKATSSERELYEEG
jgi:uncharacterized DUF497 family protein